MFPALPPKVYEISMHKHRPAGRLVWQTGSRLWRETERYTSTWSLRCPFASRRERGCKQNGLIAPWRSGRGRLVDACETEAGQTYAGGPSECWESVRGAFVRAAKLTIYASYW